MTGLEMLQVAALVVGVGTPVATLIYSQGAIKQRLTGIEKMQAELLKQEAECQTKREAVEEALHDRITGVVKDVGYLKGRLNGGAK